MNLEVNTFSLGSDKDAALKPLEEAAEVFAAWQRLYDAQIEYGCVGVDGDYSNEFEAFSRYELERGSLAYEIADSAIRNNGIGDCYANLAAAIIEQACADYINTPSGIFERTKRDCERFFRSDWFHLLSGGAVDGEKALVALREQRRQRIARERERKRMEREGVADEER